MSHPRSSGARQTTVGSDLVNPAAATGSATDGTPVAGLTAIVPLGYTAEYELTVTNTGDVALRNVRVSDQRIPACACPTRTMPRSRWSSPSWSSRSGRSRTRSSRVASPPTASRSPTHAPDDRGRSPDRRDLPECSREIGTLGALQTVSYVCDVTTPEQAGQLVNKAYVGGRMPTRSYTHSASAAIMIITTIPGAPPSGPLAATGANSSSASAIAALLLVMGFLFPATGRYRRRKTMLDDQC